MVEQRLSAVDLFCGAGGFSLAAIRAGFQVLAGVENEPHAVSTYRRNFCDEGEGGWPKVYGKSILELDFEAFADELQIGQGELDLLLGGPPCQGYSQHRILNSGVDDPRNELLIQYFAAVSTLRPRAFVVENVPGLLWPRHAKFLNQFVKLCSDSGYELFGPQLLNARDYGVPQNRKRVFFCGFRNDLKRKFEWPAATHFSPESTEVLEGKAQPWVAAKTVFTRRRAGDKNWIHMRHGPEVLSAIASTPKNGGSRSESSRVLPCHRRHDGHKDVYGRIDPSKPGPTMTTACINPSKGRFVHPTADHGITVRHAARFQGFPDDFVFKGGLIATGVQIGNAVPIGLGEAVIGAVRDFLQLKQESERSELPSKRSTSG